MEQIVYMHSLEHCNVVADMAQLHRAPELVNLQCDFAKARACALRWLGRLGVRNACRVAGTRSGKCPEAKSLKGAIPMCPRHLVPDGSRFLLILQLSNEGH